MCHPKIPFVNQEGLIVHTRWLVLQRSNGEEHEPRHVHHGDGGDSGSSGESGSVKRCVCSPSQHPGSFRCRQHHGEYVWRGITIK